LLPPDKIEVFSFSEHFANGTLFEAQARLVFAPCVRRKFDLAWTSQICGVSSRPDLGILASLFKSRAKLEAEPGRQTENPDLATQAHRRDEPSEPTLVRTTLNGELLRLGFEVAQSQAVCAWDRRLN
jgi:hypothetical protein